MRTEITIGETITLTKCKECGCEPEINYDPPRTIVFCEGCGVFIGDENEPLIAFDNWNLLNIIGKIKATLTGPDKDFLIRRLP